MARAAAGPGWTIADLVSSPIWSRRLKWDPGAATTAGAQPINIGFNAGYGLGGSALHRFMRTAAKHLDAVTLLGEDLPDPDSRVVLGAGRDKFGVPRAELSHTNSG